MPSINKLLTPKAIGRVGQKLIDPICIHLEFVHDDTGPTVDFRKCKYKAEVGFLCKFHDSKLLNKVSAGVLRDFDYERVGTVIKGTARELAHIEREVIGLKFKIQFEKGRRMRTDPEAIAIKVAREEGVPLAAYDFPIFPQSQ